MRRRRRLSLLVPIAVLSLLAAACAEGDDDDDAGGGGSGGEEGVVTMFGPEVEAEADSLQTAFDPFTEDTGIEIQYTGDRSAEEQIGVRVQGGDPPDIFIFPQPGRLRQFAESGDLIPLPDNVVEEVEANFDPFWVELATVDGEVYGVPNKSDLKSLVWYSPAAFEAGGYEVPETLADFEALQEDMRANGDTPWCIGIGSDAATGWPFTDWVEDFMLRLKGPDVYDQWVNHEIPFNDPDVVEVGEYVYDIWSTEGNVFGGTELIASTPFAEAGLPLLDGTCLMHRQANFYQAQFPDGTTFGPEGQINAFYLPVNEEFGDVVLTAGTFAAAFRDSQEVMDTLAYMASPEYAEQRTPDGTGFLSANTAVDTSLYPSEFEGGLAEILVAADPFRFDASDQMPGEVGSGSFWTAAVDITTGTKTVQEAFDDVEASWPS
jgi:alpha-glucoside transport system substrate-binding protein